jgi:hypothetical protein
MGSSHTPSPSDHSSLPSLSLPSPCTTWSRARERTGGGFDPPAVRPLTTKRVWTSRHASTPHGTTITRPLRHGLHKRGWGACVGGGCVCGWGVGVGVGRVANGHPRQETGAGLQTPPPRRRPQEGQSIARRCRIGRAHTQPTAHLRPVVICRRSMSSARARAASFTPSGGSRVLGHRGDATNNKASSSR